MKKVRILLALAIIFLSSLIFYYYIYSISTKPNLGINFLNISIVHNGINSDDNYNFSLSLYSDGYANNALFGGCSNMNYCQFYSSTAIVVDLDSGNTMSYSWSDIKNNFKYSVNVFNGNFRFKKNSNPSNYEPLGIFLFSSNQNYQTKAMNDFLSFDKAYSFTFEVPYIIKSSYKQTVEGDRITLSAESEDNWNSLSDYSYRFCSARRDYDENIDMKIPNCSNYSTLLASNYSKCVSSTLEANLPLKIIFYKTPLDIQNRIWKCEFDAKNLEGSKEYVFYMGLAKDLGNDLYQTILLDPYDPISLQ